MSGRAQAMRDAMQVCGHQIHEGKNINNTIYRPLGCLAVSDCINSIYRPLGCLAVSDCISSIAGSGSGKWLPDVLIESGNLSVSLLSATVEQ